MTAQYYDYIVVGCGLYGAVIAERLHHKNKKVLIIERRDHVGGNCYSFRYPETNIEVHKYGTHIFHTNSKIVWDYVNNYVEFNILLGISYTNSTRVLKILAFIPIVVFMSNAFGAQLLLPFNLKKLFTYSIIIPSITHLFLLIIVVPRYSYIGVASVAVFTEVFVLAYRVIGLYYYHNNIIRNIFYGK